jgi:hypothetical protein
MQIIDGNSKTIKAAKKKYHDLLLAPPLSTNLGEMSKLILSTISYQHIIIR